MKKLKEFDIDYVNLNDGKFALHYVINNDFFKNFDYSPTQKGTINVEVTLIRSSSMMDFLFKIVGSVELICDRSLEEFDFKIDLEKKLLVKLSDKNEEVTDELIYINIEDATFNLAQYIYEFIVLEIPMKKLHPKFSTEEEDDEIDSDILIYTSEDKKEEETIDPRWAALKSITKNNNK